MKFHNRPSAADASFEEDENCLPDSADSMVDLVNGGGAVQA